MRAYSASTPAVEAIATLVTASPTCARSIFVTRGSLETNRDSRSSAICTLSAVGTSAEAASNSSGSAVTSAASGSTLNSSGSASVAFSRALTTAARTSSTRGVGGEGVAQPAVTDQPHAEPTGLGERQPFDLTAERARLGLP